MVESALKSKHRFVLLLVSCTIILTIISFYSASDSDIDKQLHNANTIPITGQRKSRLAIDNITNISQIDTTSATYASQQTTLATIFHKYLDPICNTNQNNASFPSDCFILLQAMINISLSLDLHPNEVEILAQRLSYLSALKHTHMTQPILYIHIPKTGGTGFGKWLTSSSHKKTLHLWVPDNMTPNMFDNIHYPHRNRRRLRKNIHINREINKRKPTPKKQAFPQVLYGHAAYGTDLLFLSPEQIDTLRKNPTDIIWKPRVNFTYVTILRHPLTRVPSHYFYHRSGAKDENHKWAIQRDLYDWISWFEESAECLVQFISGCHQRAWYSKKYIDVMDKDLNPWPRREQAQSPDIFNGLNVTFGQYKIARLHLLQMGWVGLTEHLAESVEQLKVFWALHTKQGSIKSNVNAKKPRKTMSDKIVEKIKEYNKYDIALWELAYVLFLQQKIVVKYGYNVDIDERKKKANHNEVRTRYGRKHSA